MADTRRVGRAIQIVLPLDSDREHFEALNTYSNNISKNIHKTQQIYGQVQQSRLNAKIARSWYKNSELSAGSCVEMIWTASLLN